MRFLALALLAALLLTGCDNAIKRDADGKIMRSGGIAVGELRTADCFNELPDLLADDFLAEVVEGTPCTEPHRYEVFHVFDAGRLNERWPGLDEVIARAQSGCDAAFQPYTGSRSDVTNLESSLFYSNEWGWQNFDYDVICVLEDPDRPLLNGSLRDSLL